MRWFPIALTAALLAAGSAPSASTPAKLGLCVGCHGRDGRATLPGYPHLNGQDAEYLYQQLLAYKQGNRRHGPMQAVVGALSAAELRELAQYYAAQPCR
jgi:cytochrome c553